MKPSIGRIVIARTLKSYNGTHEHPAIVTRVHGANDPAEAKGANVMVNVTVIPDCSDPFCMSSARLFETKDEADASGDACVAWWPARV